MSSSELPGLQGRVVIGCPSSEGDGRWWEMLGPTVLGCACCPDKHRVAAQVVLGGVAKACHQVQHLLTPSSLPISNPVC